MKLRHQQQGMTAIGWLIVLGIVGFFAMVVMRLLPIYLEYQSVSNSLEVVANDPANGNWTKDDIKSRLYKLFTINQVTRVDLQKDLKIERDEKTGKRKVTIKYQATTPMVYNVEALVKFEKTVETRAPE